MPSKMRKERLLKIVAGVLLACGLLIWQHASILEAYALFFRKDNATPGADAIVVLSSPRLERLVRAFELGANNFAPRILVTTTPKRPTKIFGLKYPSTMEWVEAVAASLESSVPVDLLPSLGDGARSTFDEAYDARQWALDNNYKRIIIVTNAFHSRRALYAFEKVFSESGVEVEVGAAPNPSFTAKNWWLIDSGLAAYLTEPLKFAAYIFFDHSPDFIENR